MWIRSQPTSEKNLETSLSIFHSGPETNVMNTQSRMIFSASFESDLELATKVLVVFVAHEVLKQSLGIWANIKRFRRRRSREIASSDIANSVAARFSRSNSSFSQKP